MILNRKIGSFVVEITWLKIATWIVALWLLLTLIISNIQGVEINNYLFGKAGHSSSGDDGVVLIVTTWVAWIITLFIRGRLDKIFAGTLMFFLGLISFIGTLVTSPSASTILGWSIPTVILSGIGVLYTLDGSGIIKMSTKKQNKPHPAYPDRNPSDSYPTPPSSPASRSY